MMMTAIRMAISEGIVWRSMMMMLMRRRMSWILVEREDNEQDEKEMTRRNGMTR